MINLRRKEFIKNTIFITFILAFAAVVTYGIYHNFKDQRELDYNSETLDVTFHEKTGDKVTLKRVTPVRDSIGLSSKAYTFTIKNNLSTSVNYIVKMVKDNEVIETDQCGEYLIPNNIIKLSIHRKGKDNHIQYLNDLEDGIVVTSTIKPNEEIKYTMRFWITENTLTAGADLHYHGIIKVLQTENEIATAIN